MMHYKRACITPPQSSIMGRWGGAGKWDPRPMPRLFIIIFFDKYYNQMQTQIFQQEKKIQTQTETRVLNQFHFSIQIQTK